MQPACARIATLHMAFHQSTQYLFGRAVSQQKALQRISCLTANVVVAVLGPGSSAFAKMVGHVAQEEVQVLLAFRECFLERLEQLFFARLLGRLGDLLLKQVEILPFWSAHVPAHRDLGGIRVSQSSPCAYVPYPFEHRVPSPPQCAQR